MTGWVLAAGQSHVDVVARVIAVAGLLVATGSASLTWYLWHRSGPALKVKCEIGISVKGNEPVRYFLAGAAATNPGRMPAVMTEAFIFTVPQSKAWQLRPAHDRFPVTIPPTGRCGLVFDDISRPNAGTVVEAYVLRGDGRGYRSKPHRVLGEEPGWSRTMSTESEPDPG